MDGMAEEKGDDVKSLDGANGRLIVSYFTSHDKLCITSSLLCGMCHLAIVSSYSTSRFTSCDLPLRYLTVQTCARRYDNSQLQGGLLELM